MTRLFVLDFDKTLIPYDSWNRFLRKIILRSPIRIGIALFLRRIGVLSRGELKREITNVVANNKRLRTFSDSFIKTVSKDVVLPSLLFGMNDIKLVILSASPMCYMCYLNKYLDCKCDVVGSDYIAGEYVEMYGEQKLNYLKNHYSHDQYKYEYAMSDSESDMIWMLEFEHCELKKN